MKDLIRQLEAERDAALASWKAPPATETSRGESAAEAAQGKLNWLARLQGLLAPRRPRA
jgi:hypothetical protein